MLQPPCQSICSLANGGWAAPDQDDRSQTHKKSRVHDFKCIALMQTRMRIESSLDGRIVNLRPILSEVEVVLELSVELSRTISCHSTLSITFALLSVRPPCAKVFSSFEIISSTLTKDFIHQTSCIGAVESLHVTHNFDCSECFTMGMTWGLKACSWSTNRPWGPSLPCTLQLHLRLLQRAPLS
jgi:hypothetical protein